MSDIIDNVKQDKSEQTVVSAYNIETDKLHRFVTDEQIKEYNDKISAKDLEDALLESESSLRSDFNKKYDNIYNTPEIYKSIKKLSAMMNTDEDILELIKSLKNLNVEDELNEHINSGNHIEDSDRDALDNLKFVVNNSYADWNASPSDINYIRNKPTSLKANGGNSDTVGGYTPKQLMVGTKSDTIVIGCKDNINCDYYIQNPSEDISYIIQPIINNMKDGGSILFREGSYNISQLFIFNDYISIKGVGMATKLNINSFNVQASQFILNNCNLFTDIFALQGTNIFIKGNRITNTGDGSCIQFKKFINSIIKDNFFIGVNMLYCYGNIISDNIYS